MELQHGDSDIGNSNETGSVVIRVNPEKMLPDSGTITHGKEKVAITFDYPAEVPADIYALGVPRNAPVENRMPPPDPDQIIKIVQQHRRDFGNYLAIGMNVLTFPKFANQSRA